MKYILFLYHQYEINHLLLPPSPDDEDTILNPINISRFSRTLKSPESVFSPNVVVLPVSRKIPLKFYKLT